MEIASLLNDGTTGPLTVFWAIGMLFSSMATLTGIERVADHSPGAQRQREAAFLLEHKHGIRLFPSGALAYRVRS